jgi:hypothetical protein
MESYYDRAAHQNTDGTPLFACARDAANESETAEIVGRAWRCEVYPFGRLCPVDYYAVRHGRLVGVMELKSRAHESGRYATVFLNVRKWLALTVASVGLGVPALFLVRWTNEVRYIALTKVDARRAVMGGAMRIVKSRSDVEPVVEIPVASMRVIEDAAKSG